MTLKQIAALGRKLTLFLSLFADCFKRREGRDLLRVYVNGQLSDIHRKNVEAMALEFGTSPRTLQRFLESIKWDEEKLRDRCQQIVASEHAHPEAIGCIDESGTTKSGKETVGAGRQWNGNRGKNDNCVVGVHLSYWAPGFQTLLDSTVYLPEDYANDAARRKKTTCPRKSYSARNHRSPWSKSITHLPMDFAYLRGRSTNSMAATVDFSMVSNRKNNCS
jgi:SRSO17 transposase